MKKIIKITNFVLIAIFALAFQANTAFAQTSNVSSCSSATLHGYISPVGSASTVWFEWSSNSSSVSNGNGNVTGSQTFTSNSYFEKTVSGLNESSTYYYRTVARNAKGTVYGDVASFKTASCGNNNNNNNDSSLYATTNSATNITDYSARLNGSVNSNGSGYLVRWFEYGTNSGDLSQTTGRSSVYGSSDVSQTVTNLSSDRTYYFRVVVQGDGKTSYGEVRSFTTRTGNNNNDNSDLSVTTNSATDIDNTSATLRGYVNLNGSDNVDRWFEWGTSSSNLSRTTSRNSISNSGSASAYISGLSTNSTYYFRIVAEGNSGTEYGSIQSFSTKGSDSSSDNYPTVTTRSATGVGSVNATINGYVDANGGSDTYGWFEWGTSTGNLNHTTTKRYQGSSDSAISSEISGLSANTTYYYRAVSENSRGIARGSILSFTTVTGTVSNTGAPSGVTMLATNVNASSATLNSLVLQSGSQSTSAWFEWGTNESLGRRTSTTNVGSAASVRHAEFINGLSNGTTYYFRIVVENESGRNYGVIRSFKAQSAYVAPVVISKPTVIKKPVVVAQPTVKKVAASTVKRTITTVVEHAEGVSSLVMLTITGEENKVSTGNSQTYTITWRNNSDENLRNVVLRVIIPQTLSFESADDGTYSKVDNMHTLLIGDLAAGEEGQLSVVLKGGNTLKSEDLVVTTANIVYTDEQDIQGDALAYVTQKVSSVGSVLGASAGAASAPIAIIGWLILIILIIILCILIHNLYKRVSDKKE